MLRQNQEQEKVFKSPIKINKNVKKITKNMLNKTTKHEKYSQDWNNLMKVFVGKEIETKLTELNTISQELKDKLSAKEDFKNAYKHKQGTKREKTRLETVITNGNEVIAK